MGTVNLKIAENHQASEIKAFYLECAIESYHHAFYYGYDTLGAGWIKTIKIKSTLIYNLIYEALSRSQSEEKLQMLTKFEFFYLRL